MTSLRTAGVWLVIAGLGVSACGSNGGGTGTTTATTGSTGSGSHVCAPGQQVICPCLGGGQGVQVCNAKGSGFEACMGCDSGVGGTGGAPATTTSSTTSGNGGATTSSTTSGMGGAGTTSSTSTGSPFSCTVGSELDLGTATIYDNPPDIANWPITTKLTEVDFRTDGVHLEFDKRDGPNRWPDIIPPGWMGPLEYTVGMAECINGQWYASAAIQYWYGLDASGGNIGDNNQVAVNWYYDGRWGMLAGRQPPTGEPIGIFVVAGNARGVHTDDPLNSPVMERSNVVILPMPDANGANHSIP